MGTARKQYGHGSRIKASSNLKEVASVTRTLLPDTELWAQWKHEILWLRPKQLLHCSKLNIKVKACLLSQSLTLTLHVVPPFPCILKLAILKQLLGWNRGSWFPRVTKGHTPPSEYSGELWRSERLGFLRIFCIHAPRPFYLISRDEKAPRFS